jgi:hypothetical protein
VGHIGHIGEIVQMGEVWEIGEIRGLIEAGEEVSNTVLIPLNKSDSSSSSAGHHTPNMPTFAPCRRDAGDGHALK